MKFISAVISQHDAFALSRIQTLTIDFTKSNVFIILGSNGSGKSSLLQLLLNWPDDADRYRPGGYKVVNILHESRAYELSCRYHSSNDKYTITSEGQLLYKGSHGQMFSSTIEKHLGINKLYKSLLLENTQITKMNSSQRSQWLMDISGVDYTWALQLYDKLKTNRNTFSSSARVNAQRLTQMNAQATTTEDELELKNRQTVLMDSISYMHSVRMPSTSTTHEATDELRAHLERYNSLLDGANSKRHSDMNTDTVEGVKAVIEHLKELIVSLSTQINKKYEVIQECKSFIGDSGNETINTLTSQAQQLTEQIDELLDSMSIIQDCGLAPAAKAMEHYNSLYRWFKDFTVQWDSCGGVYSPHEYAVATESHSKALSRQAELNAALERISGRLEHYEHHLNDEKTKCPQCDHSFIAGYNKADHDDTKLKLGVVKCLIDKHKNKLHESTLNMVEHESRKDLWYQWSKFVNDYSYMAEWLNTIMKQHIDTGVQLFSLWERFGCDLTALVKENQLDDQLLACNKKIEHIKYKNEQDIKDAHDRMELTQEQLSDLTKRLQRLIMTADKYEKKLSDLKSSIHLKDKIIQSYNETSALVSSVDEVYRQHYLDTALKNMQSDLASVQLQLRKIDQSSALIESIKTNIESDKFTSQCWSALVKAMSPKDGIIGKSLVAFLSDFFQDVNNFIEQVWSYELSIVPMDIGEDGQSDMDYQFKLMQDSKILKDISHGSEAMKYIVDLAFRLTALLRLKDAGVAMLDEPFTSLDQKHRSQATVAMKALVESDLFEQLFIISHHSEFSLTFGSASIICLDPRNISVPSNANAHVKIDYY